MTIEAGALSIRITEVGAEQVLTQLNAIDAKAKALGQATQTVKFNVPSLTGANNQLQLLGSNFARVQQAAAGAAPPIHNLPPALDRTRASTESLTAALGKHILLYVSFRTAVQAYDAVSEASDRQDTAQRKLAATAKLTGSSLSTINAISATAQERFQVSSSVAADLTQAFVKLAFRSGDVTRAGSLMNAWMDLGTANGQSLDQILQSVNTTLSGQDEGLNRLGLMNPSQIWAKWGAEVGLTVGKMTDQQKWQAIVNEVTQQGAAVQGEYAKFLASTQGEQQTFNTTLEQTEAAVGRNIQGFRNLAYEIGTVLGKAFLAANTFLDNYDKAVQRLDQRITPEWLKRILIPLHLMGKPEPQFDRLSADEDLAALVSKKPAPPAPVLPRKPSAEELAAERERRAALQKARDIDRATIGQIGLVNTGPAGPMIAPSVGLDGKGKMKGEKAFGLADVIDKEFDALEEKMKARIERLQGVVGTIAQSVGGAFGDAFSAAFKGGDFFAEFGKSMLSSLGNVVMQLGEQLLAYGLVIAPLAALLAFTPFGGLGLGAGASIAAGLALTAIGAAMGAAGGGGGGKGGGGGAGGSTKPQEPSAFAVAFDPDGKLRKQSSAVAPSARSINGAPLPDKQPTFVFAPTIIGKDDAKAQKDLAYMVERVVVNGGARRIRGG